MRRRRRTIIMLLVFLFLCEPAARFVYAHQPPRSGEILTYETGRTGYLAPADFSGKLYHVKDGIRLTVGNPKVYEHTIWMFGNSSLLGFNVPDADTIPSQLQALLPDYRVLNLSAEGQLARGELAWLKEVPLRAGDSVIFMDGSTDAYYLRERASIITPWLRRECALPVPQRFSAVLDLPLCALVQSPAMDRALLAETGQAFQSTIEEARAYSAQHGAAFYHFMQPGLLVYWGEVGQALAARTPVLIAPEGDDSDTYGHVHLAGATSVARQLFDHLTIF